MVGQDRPVGGEVGVNAGVGLYVSVLSAEQSAGMLGGDRLDGVNVLATGVEAVAGSTFGVLIREPGTHGRQNWQGCVVFGSNKFEGMTLVGEFSTGGLRDPRLDLCDRVEHGAVGRG